jgi:ABC-type branched-subunit amino acid transport system ATPase component
LRFRGLFLAVATLAFALAAQSSLFRFEFVSGNSAGNASVGDPRIVGLGSIQSPRALYYVALAVLAVVVLALRSLRSTGAGRALIAVRDNERVAAAHGLSPMAVKVLALGMSGFVAGVAGGLWAGIQHSWSAQLIDPSFGITMLGLAIVGGVGRLHGPILGALAVFALPYLPDGWNTAPVRALSSGVLLLVILLFLPGGLASLLDRARLAALRWIERGLPEQPFAPVDGADPIVVTDLSVSFGGLKAVDEASLRVGAGEIVGLMGGNGAGKTTLLNAISGHQGTERGRVVLYGRDVTGLAPEFRPALAAARTFQDAQLYPGLTVLETVQVALDRTNRTGTLGGLVSAPWARAGERRKRERAVEVLGRFGLGDRLDTKVSELSTGMRRLLDIACVVASGPKLVLLDEPMAGVAQREVEAFAPMLRALRDELGCSVLIIEHDVPLLTSLCDRIYAMEAGAIIADGSPHQVCSDPRVVAGYLGTDTLSVRRSGGRRPKPARPARRTTTGRRSTTTKTKEGSTAR